MADGKPPARSIDRTPDADAVLAAAAKARRQLCGMCKTFNRLARIQAEPLALRVKELERLNGALAARVAAQSEVLARRARRNADASTDEQPTEAKP